MFLCVLSVFILCLGGCDEISPSGSVCFCVKHYPWMKLKPSKYAAVRQGAADYLYCKMLQLLLSFFHRNLIKRLLIYWKSKY